MNLDTLCARGPWTAKDGVVHPHQVRQLYLAIDEGVSAPAASVGLDGDRAVRALAVLRREGLIKRVGVKWVVA